MVPTLVISGPVGVGKTTIGREVSEHLEGQGIYHTFVDLDALTETFPRPADDPFGEKLATANLADVWRNSYQAGSRNLVLARVIEADGQLERIRSAVPGARITTVRLSATREDLLARVRTREIGSGRSWHETRSLELADALERSAADLVVDTTGRPLPEIAKELIGAVSWAVE